MELGAIGIRDGQSSRISCGINGKMNEEIQMKMTRYRNPRSLRYCAKLKAVCRWLSFAVSTA